VATTDPPPSIAILCTLSLSHMEYHRNSSINDEIPYYGIKNVTTTVHAYS